jgi:hypothetical protein
MKLPDCRGLFLRGAGTGSYGSNYAGGSIGQFIADATREASGYLGAVPGDPGNDGVFYKGGGNGTYYTTNPGYGSQDRCFALSRMVPTAAEIRPASISLYPCITF